MSCAVLAVLPIVPRPLPAAAATPLPPGWSAAFAALQLPASATVLTVPVPMSTFTEPLRWQADTGQPATLVGGYFIVDCKDLDEAIEVAAKIPGARDGSIEVRPIWEM